MASLPQGVSGRPYCLASMQANTPQVLSWQHRRARQTVIMQANTEPIPPNPNAHQHCEQRVGLLYYIIIRQECQIQRLEQQLAEAEAKMQSEGSSRGRREDTGIQFSHKQEDSQHEGHQSTAKGKQAERGN
ncbi:hypothetical protein V8C37DRAFT_413611 [Trichoderma ceciliae]